MSRFAIILSLFLSIPAFAQPRLGMMGSLLYNVPETKLDDTQGVDEESKLGFGIGMRALVPIVSGLYLRSGAGLVQKNVSYEFTMAGAKGQADFSFTYLNIPVTLYFSGLDEKFGIFFGTAIQAKLSDDCNASGALDACEAVNEKSLVFPTVLGFDFSFAKNFSIELSYEHGFMETAKDLKVNSAILSFIYNL